MGKLQSDARTRVWLSAVGVVVGEYLLLRVVLDFAIYATVSQAMPGHPAVPAVSSVAMLGALLAYVTWGPSPARNPWVWGTGGPLRLPISQPRGDLPSTASGVGPYGGWVSFQPAPADHFCAGVDTSTDRDSCCVQGVTIQLAGHAA